MPPIFEFSGSIVLALIIGAVVLLLAISLAIFVFIKKPSDPIIKKEAKPLVIYPNKYNKLFSYLIPIITMLALVFCILILGLFIFNIGLV